MIDEKAILKQLRNPQTREAAFTRVIKEYQEILYGQIRRMVLSHDDADDVLQNTFIKAWDNIDTFREDAKLLTWLFRIAINESLNFLGKKSRTASRQSDVDAADLLEGDPYFDGDALEMQLQQAIQTLPEKQRVVFNLKYFQEMKYEVMSQALGTSVGALKASYHIAVGKIADFFKRQD